MMNSHLSEQEIIRREKLAELEKLGINSFPAPLYPVSHYSIDIKDGFNESTKEQYADVCVAGRIMSVRDMGKACFAVIQDSKGRIQIYVKRDELCCSEDKTLYDVVFKKLLDIGDIIGVKGYVFTTKTGETSIHIKELTLLAKSLKPLPVVKEAEGQTFDAVTDPEFTILEWYTAYKDYFWMMEITEQLLEKVAISLHGTTDVKVGEQTISFKTPFKRVSIFEAIKEHTGTDVSGLEEDGLREVCKKLHIPVDASMGKGKLIDELFSNTSESKYIQPTFITDYPVEMSPLTKKHRDKAGLVERFELMINGKEIANAYSELNDPVDQRERFEEQVKLKERGDDEAMFIDYDFLRALEYGMPPTAGIGIGIDRLVMLMTNQPSIQDVLLFPMMRPERTGE
ncbi:MAG: lysine--tRNA ligase [Bacteroidota bacterium]